MKDKELSDERDGITDVSVEKSEKTVRDDRDGKEVSREVVEKTTVSDGADAADETAGEDDAKPKTMFPWIATAAIIALGAAELLPEPK